MPPHDRPAQFRELPPYPVPVPEGIQTKSGLPSTSTFLRGDGVWATPPAGTSLRPATIVIAASDSKHAGADYVCTGTDDDLTINAAIAEIDGAPKGGSILFLDGTYSLGHKIVSPARGAVPGYVLRGSGASKIQAQDPATFPDDCFLEIKNTGTSPQGADCVTLIQNLLFDQNNASGTDLQSTSAIKCAGTAVQGLVIEDCAFSNLQGHALNLRGAAVRVHRNFFGNCQAAGNFTPFGVDDGVILVPTGGVFLLWVQDNDFANYGNSGLDVNVTESNVTITVNAFGYSGGVLLTQLEHGPSSVVANNTELALKVRGGGTVNMELAVTGNTGERIALQDCWDVTVSGNMITGPSNDVRTPDPDADDVHHIALTDCDHCQVVGNRLSSRHVPGHFIALSGSSNCMVHDNVIAGGSGATYDGIFLDADSNANSVQGNLVRPADALNGVTVNSVDCDDNLIIDNDLSGTWAGLDINDQGTGTYLNKWRDLGLVSLADAYVSTAATQTLDASAPWSVTRQQLILDGGTVSVLEPNLFASVSRTYLATTWTEIEIEEWGELSIQVLVTWAIAAGDLFGTRRLTIGAGGSGAAGVNAWGVVQNSIQELADDSGNPGTQMFAGTGLYVPRTNTSGVKPSIRVTAEAFGSGLVAATTVTAFTVLVSQSRDLGDIPY